jgi:hypothetical protein
MTLHPEHTPSAKGSALLRRRTWVWIALGGVLVAILTAVQVTITDPRVQIRWNQGVGSAERLAAERRYELRNGVPVDDGWRYELGDLSQENILGLIEDPAVDDTGYIDRDTLTSEGRDIRVTVWYPFSDLFDRPAQLLQLHRSVWLLLAGGVLLRAARASSARGRRNMTVATLLFVGVMTVALPLDPAFVTMGGSADHVRSRDDFDRWFGERVRFEKHLSQTILLQLYQQFPQTDAAPERAVIAMSRGAAGWLVLSAVAIGFLERWSAVALRYLGLALLAPSALLYFGWREFGYLSLSVATFPLLARGLRDGGTRLEAGSAFAGLGAALHGSGLVSLAGAWLAALGTSGQLRDRVGRVLRVAVWGTAAYLGWIAVYVIVLNLPVHPDAGPVAFSSWRPWFVDEVRAGRVSAAILSTTGARDLLMTAWVVGAPLLLVVVSLRKRYAHEVRAALWYIPPSILFVIFRWPFEGIGGGMDLIVAGFPALYALAWVCAQDSKRTNIAAALLISAHYAFWRIVLDERFWPLRVD